MQTGAFKQEREDHVLDLTMELVRSYAIRPVDRDLQVDASRNKEDTGASSILEVDEGSDQLDADQPQDHCIDRLLVSLIVTWGFHCVTY